MSSTNDIKVSIITVTYNSAKTLKDTIQSIARQTYPNIEYIIVDGKSSDSTVDIIKSYEKELSIKWISEKDKGLYDAMNKGIKMATGDIIGILNSDDFYHKTDAIENIVKGFTDEYVDCVFADMRYVHPSNLNKTVRYYSSKKFKPAKFKWGYMPGHPTFFVRKKYFDEYGLYQCDYKIAADFELLMRFLYKHKISYRYLPFDLLKMRTGGKSTESIKSNIILNKEIIRACKENGINTNMILLSFKYFVKIFEFVFTRNR